jgi:hypothetical protein
LLVIILLKFGDFLKTWKRKGQGVPPDTVRKGGDTAPVLREFFKKLAGNLG